MTTGVLAVATILAGLLAGNELSTLTVAHPALERLPLPTQIAAERALTGRLGRIMPFVMTATIAIAVLAGRWTSLRSPHSSSHCFNNASDTGAASRKLGRPGRAEQPPFAHKPGDDVPPLVTARSAVRNAGSRRWVKSSTHPACRLGGEEGRTKITPVHRAAGRDYHEPAHLSVRAGT